MLRSTSAVAYFLAGILLLHAFQGVVAFVRGSNGLHSAIRAQSDVLLFVTATSAKTPLRRCIPTHFMTTTNNVETSNELDSSEGDLSSIPAKLCSSVGIDYIPLATMLATKDFLGADQFTRDHLIRIAGPDAVKRGFVYFTDVQRLPIQDLVTIEKLWLHFSDGHFGYSVQQRVWEFDRGNFDNFIRRIGWTVSEGGLERKRKWFGANEFVYSLEKAPKGHLPLTSALRGTQLIKKLMELPLWKQYDWKNHAEVPWEVKS